MSLTEKMSDSEEVGCFIGAKNFLVFFDFKFCCRSELKEVKNGGSHGFNLLQKRDLIQIKLNVKALGL